MRGGCRDFDMDGFWVLFRLRVTLALFWSRITKYIISLHLTDAVHLVATFSKMTGKVLRKVHCTSLTHNLLSVLDPDSRFLSLYKNDGIRSRITRYICSPSAPNLPSVRYPISTVAERHVSGFRIPPESAQALSFARAN